MGSKIKLTSKFLAAFMMVIWGFALSCASVKAQTYNEIFRQKKTQEEYLVKQIAYLKLYANQAWKGYKLVSGGLETINDFTSGEFKLHEAFFSALSKVSSLVKRDFRVEEIVKFQLSINSGFRDLQKSSALGSDHNQDYYKGVQENIIAECNAELGELMDIVLSGSLEMNDAERLARLKKIHSSMEEKAGFTRWFCAEAELLSRAKKMEMNDVNELRRFYGQH